ncbi:MAG: transporter substrate-binding domain-containing protein, partial [Pseudomonadota bacterium]
MPIRSFLRWWIALALLVGLGSVGAAWANQPPAAVSSPTLELVRKRGVLQVGVKNDYPPFGMLDAGGALQGFEIDMARELARRLGVRVTLFPVTGANRLQKLEEGAVDVVIATMGDTADRRRIATAVEPNYYASGVTLMLRPETRFKDWQELRGQTVCATQGSYFNRAMSQRYLLNLLTFNHARDARLALRDGRCIGYMFDNTAIWSDLRQPEWDGYHAPLPPAMSAPWAVAVARGEAGTELERWIGDVMAQWHREGFLIGLEQKWG